MYMEKAFDAAVVCPDPHEGKDSEGHLQQATAPLCGESL